MEWIQNQRRRLGIGPKPRRDLEQAENLEGLYRSMGERLEPYPSSEIFDEGAGCPAEHPGEKKVRRLDVKIEVMADAVFDDDVVPSERNRDGDPFIDFHRDPAADA